MNRKCLYIAAMTLAIGTGLTSADRSRAADASSTAPATAPAEGGPNKFYGSISAIDTTAKTFTVDNQTYNIVGESQMTKAEDGSTATLADAKVGDPARGSYTKSADGKLNVTKVRFGKKTGGKSGGGKSGGKKNGGATTQPAAE